MKRNYDFLDFIEIIVGLFVALGVRTFFDWIITFLPFELPPVLFYILLLALAFSVLMIIHNQIFMRIRFYRAKKNQP
jgi:hypothetical protein